MGAVPAAVMETAGAAPALGLSGLSKSFGAARVLDDVSFTLASGEIHALLGENGAGKSTLMNILTGIYAADGGRIEIDGAAVALASPAEAIARGVGMVHQHFRLCGPFTARENVALAAGALPALRRRGESDARLAAAMARTGLAVPLDVAVERLSVADRQRIEILKALSLGARILILDEPTAVLTDDESDRLLSLVRTLAAEGTSIVFITHKLREVMAAADRVTVMRHGRITLAGAPVAAVSVADLSEAMMGTAGAAAPAPAPVAPGEVLLDLAGLSTPGGAGLREVNLALRAGEIVGIAGVGGNGQQDLADAILGLRAASGRITLAGTDIGAAAVGRRRDLGLRHIPADRSRQALAPDASLAQNLGAGAVRAGRLGRWVLSHRRLGRLARELIAAFGIQGDTAGGARPVRLLSGGNAQKAVLARELDTGARVIVAHSPTRGLDLAACREVHDRLARAAARGAAVLLISEDIEEILALSDRIHVMSRGRLTTTPGGRPDRAAIGRLMLGHA